MFFFEPKNPRRERGAVPQEQKGFDAISFVRHDGTRDLPLPVQEVGTEKYVFLLKRSRSFILGRGGGIFGPTFFERNVRQQRITCFFVCLLGGQSEKRVG